MSVLLPDLHLARYLPPVVVGERLEELGVARLLLEDVLGDGLCPKT